MTPEGKVKAEINRTISRYKAVYKFMPVPSGYGPSSLDYLLCANGHFIGIEAKAPGKKPTDRQNMCIKAIERAGGTVFVIDGSAGCSDLDAFLKEVLKNAGSAKPKTQDDGSATG